MFQNFVFESGLYMTITDIVLASVPQICIIIFSFTNTDYLPIPVTDI